MENEDTTSQEKQYCVELNLSGHPCGLLAVAGRDRCYIHGIFRATDNGRASIDIPLLEDDASLLYVYSQVARALAQGAMPAANANGIIRCCRGVQRLLEEKGKRERFEKRQKAKDRRQETENRRQETENRRQEAEDAEAAHIEIEPAQADATVPCDLEPSACAENSDAGEEEIRAPHVSPPLGDMGETCAETASGADESPAPQPWNVESPLPVVPPPQFADAPDKFQATLDRVNGKQFEAIRNRDRAIRARGGSVLKFYEGESQGVRSEIRDTF